MKHVKFHLNRFLRRVRIHDGEFDTSARAMYRDEVVYPLQAELRIVRRSTIERKQMSTKTTFKRIALVTVAALGLSIVAVAPSSAAPSAIQLSASATTGSQLTAGTYDTATAATVTLSFLNGAVAVSDTASVTAYLISAPAGNTALPILQLAETSSAWVDSASPVLIGNQDALGTENKTQVAYVAGSAASSAVSAKFRVYMNAPTKVGSYVVRLVPANVGGGGLAADPTGVTITIAVTQNAATDGVAASATSIITTAADTTSAVDVAVTSTKSVSADTERAVIKVSTLNAAGVAASESYTAIVKSGPGILGHATKANTAGGTQIGRAISVPAENWVTVYSDGSSGVSTIEIQSKAGVVLATETLTFFGDETAAKATVVNAVIGTAAATSADAILVELTDASGTIVSNVTTLYVTSSATKVISGTYTSQAVTYNALKKGYLVDLTGVAVGTASITVGTKSSAIATTGVQAAAVSVRVGGDSTKLADVKVAFDKSSYLPGELAVITVTPVDAAGLVLAPDTYTVFATGGIVAPVALGANGATITGVTAHDGGVAGAGTGADSVATYKVYMPAYQGTFVFKYTTGTMSTTALSAVARTVSVAVIAADGGAAAAAAEEALAAASDAFDAALTAAEAAEMAQSIAQEALDAVASLRKRMNTRFNAIEKLIKRLL